MTIENLQLKSDPSVFNMQGSVTIGLKCDHVRGPSNGLQFKKKEGRLFGVDIRDLHLARIHSYQHREFVPGIWCAR